VGFEPTIPASEREKTVHALERAATVTGALFRYKQESKNNYHHKENELPEKEEEKIFKLLLVSHRE
jgi:hypothetical protein